MSVFVTPFLSSNVLSLYTFLLVAENPNVRTQIHSDISYQNSYNFQSQHFILLKLLQITFKLSMSLIVTKTTSEIIKRKTNIADKTKPIPSLSKNLIFSLKSLKLKTQILIWPLYNTWNCLNGFHNLAIDAYRLVYPDQQAESLLSRSHDFILLVL